MATFQYNALTSAGRLMKGTVEAGSQDEAGEMLKQMQLTVNSIDKAQLEKPKTAIGRNEFLLFNQQLASITKAGIPLEKGLRELAHDVRSHSMRRLIDAIAGELESLWVFLDEKGVEPTNNRAERALRFAVLWRKRSNGTQSNKGNRWVERMLSLKQTCRMKSLPVFPILVNAINAYFKEQMPDLQWVFVNY